MTDTQRARINQLFDKHYPHLLNTCRLKLRQLGLASCMAEDIVQECALRLCTFDDDFLQDIIHKEQYGSGRYFFNLLRLNIIHKSLDYSNHRKSVELLDIDIPDSDRYASRLSEDEYDKLRMVSCNVRGDDFVDPRQPDQYAPICTGYVSGWVHAYVSQGRRYAYWQYSAFYGSRCKGEIPKRIKTSSSRHEAYMALCKYNLQLNKTE